MEKIFWQGTEKEVLRSLKSVPEGLTEREVRVRFLEHGPNTILNKKKKSRLKIFIENFKSPLVYILLVAAVVTLFLNKYVDATVIFTVIIINSIIGFFEELKSEKTIESLKKMASLKVIAIRNNIHKEIPSVEVVPGDIVLLEEGARVPADGRLIEAYNLKINEAILTGESTFADKIAAKSAVKNQVEANNLVFMGTTVARGRGKMLVVKTGQKTEFGQIANLVGDEFHTVTPLQKKLEKFSKNLGYMILAICFVVYVLGTLAGNNAFLMFETSVSLAVSAIPEGLPVAVTVILVLGMRRMAKKKAIIRKLSAVETLGTTTVIASDKTGTLTHNKLMVTRALAGKEFIFTGEGYGLKGDVLVNGEKSEPTARLNFLLKVAAIANDGTIRTGTKKTEVFGDPTDCAILVAAEKIGFQKKELENQYQRISELPFSSERKFLATLNKKGDEKFILVKGAVEEIIPCCDFEYSEKGKQKLSKTKKREIEKEAQEMGEMGLRVIAVCYKETAKNNLVLSDVKNGYTFLGLLGMKDTYRQGTKNAIKIAKNAGIRIIMLTGDHLETAKNIGKELGILDNDLAVIEASELIGKNRQEQKRIISQTTIFARIRPDTKYKIIETLREKGEIVAMTGDGVNDAPALSRADIGIAMGGEGSDAAKEAADMILVDDNFSTIVTAVSEGRTIFENIRKTLFYLLSTNLGEVITVVGGLVLGLPLVLEPLQILWMNMVTDTAATIPLGMEPMEEDHLKKRPRDPAESIVSGRVVKRTFLIGFTMAVAALFVFKRYLPFGVGYARTTVFTTLVVMQWLNALNARSEKRSIFAQNPFSNPALLLGLLIAVLFQMSVMYLPFLASIFHLTPLKLSDWTLVFSVSLCVIFISEFEKMFFRGAEKVKDFFSSFFIPKFLKR